MESKNCGSLHSPFLLFDIKQAFPISASVALAGCRSPGLRIVASISFPVAQWTLSRYRRSSLTVAGPRGIYTRFPLRRLAPEHLVLLSYINYYIIAEALPQGTMPYNPYFFRIRSRRRPTGILRKTRKAALDTP